MFLVLIGLGIWLTKYISSVIGINFWFLLPLTGPLLLLVAFGVGSLAHKNRYPKCIFGKCDAKDYKGVEMTDKGLHLVCKCGQHYLLYKRKFQLLNSEGKVTKYKKKAMLVRWNDDYD